MKQFKGIAMISLCLIMMFNGVLLGMPNKENGDIAKQEGTNLVEKDEKVLDKYVDNVNKNLYAQLAKCFCGEEEKNLDKFFADAQNKKDHIGIYNVKYISDYGITEMENEEIEVFYDKFEDVKIYLVWLECSVKTSNQYHVDGNNYYQMVMVTENNKRKIAEFSVACESIIFDAIGNDDFELTEEQYENYVCNRISMFEELDDFEVVAETDLNDGISLMATYTPKTLSSYVFPTNIRVKNTSTGAIVSKNFKNYCYVVSAGEFGSGTDGATTVHIEALKAFSLCVRNLAWYRCLYPYSATAQYDIDDKNDQVYNWSLESKLSSFSKNKTAMDAVWNVMMFDGTLKLFYPSYRAGKYNASTSTSESLLYQNGANYLATVKGYDYKKILHYYYDSAVGEKITKGPIVICSSHKVLAAYYTTNTGHGHKCATCGYVRLSAHTWVKSVSYYQCSVCGYKSQTVVAQ